MTKLARYGGAKKELHREIQVALDAGWTLDHTGSAHIRLTPPGEGRVIIVSLTPKIPEIAARKLRSALRRAGVEL
jgi:hypothetical protein